MGLLDEQSVELREPAECPFYREPCRAARCSLWITYRRVDGRAFVGCAFVFVPVLLGETIVELQRNQASADKVASEVQRGFSGLLQVALDHAERRALGGR